MRIRTCLLMCYLIAWSGCLLFDQGGLINLPADASAGGPIDCTDAVRELHTYVIDSEQLPTNPAEATTLALDLDQKQPLRADNTLGMVIATLAQQAGLDVTSAFGDAINRGDIIHLISQETEALDNAACARMGVFLGDNPSVEPCDPGGMNCGAHLDGQTSFELAAVSPTDAKIDGQIIGGQFSLGPNHVPGHFTIQIHLGEMGMPLSLDLIGARTRVGVGPDGLQSGLIGGAITEDDLQTSFLPDFHGIMNAFVTQDCVPSNVPCCTEGSAGAKVVDLFDTDPYDCVIALRRASPCLLSARRPDADADADAVPMLITDADAVAKAEADRLALLELLPSTVVSGRGRVAFSGDGTRVALYEVMGKRTGLRTWPSPRLARRVRTRPMAAPPGSGRRHAHLVP